MIRRIAALATLAALVGSLLAMPVGATVAGTNGRILFFNQTSSEWQTMNPDGTDVRTISMDVETSSSLRSSSGRLLPGGDQVLYGDGGSYIREITTSSTGQVDRVGMDWFFSKNPFPAPSGGEYGFFTNANTGWELWIGDSGGPDRMLYEITTPQVGSSTFEPLDGDWAPNGSRVAFSFVDNQDFTNAILYVLNTSGSVTASWGGIHPNFSPDSSKVLYVNRTTGIMETRNLDGTGLDSLDVEGYWPSWSPDGTKIVASTADGDIFTINADGSGFDIIRSTSAILLWADWGSEASTSTGPPGPFDDVPGDHTFVDEIEWVLEQAITLGCDADGDLYCPDDNVTRGQMASFLARALNLTPASGNRFSDVSGTHTANINAIAEAGISLGCDANGTLYCPDDLVSRAQMGSFLARALALAPSTTNRFSDVSGTHTGNINAIAEAGITLGCNPAGTLYCPDDNVTRGQMAAFLFRGLAG